MHLEEKRKLSAIMFTDIVGFSKIMGEAEGNALSILRQQESLLTPIIKHYDGNVIKRTGDGYLIEFPSSVNAVKSALKMQEVINRLKPDSDDNYFQIRIGIHLGDIVQIGDDILGDGVNIAARIEPLAPAGGICLTEAVYQSVKSKVDISPKRISNVDLKHIDDKYTIYKLPDDLDDDIVDYKELEKHSRKINILHEQYDNNFFNSFIKSFIYGSIFFFGGFIAAVFHTVFIEGGDFPVLTLDSTIFIAISLTATGFIVGIPTMRRTIRMTFKDIRDVENFIDILITSMHYRFVSKKDGKIEYTNTLLEPSFITQIKLKIPWMRKVESLIMQVNGNTLMLEGVYKDIRKLSKTLKQHTFIG